MAKREKTLITDDGKAILTKIRNGHMETVSRVQRVKIHLLYSKGNRISNVAKELQTNRPLIERVIDKALLLDPINPLKDLPGEGVPERYPICHKLDSFDCSSKTDRFWLCG